MPSPTDRRQALSPLSDFSGSLAQKAYASLKDAILTLKFHPGEALRKPEICEELGVSRAPLGEALARLAAEDLVELVPQAGSYVARFSMSKIQEAAFLREALELAAVEQVALTITEEQLVLLRRNLRFQGVLADDQDGAGFYAMDAQMHDLILSFTGFPRLSVLAQTTWVHVNRARQLVLPVEGRITKTLMEHQDILAALEARNPMQARAATQFHLRQLIPYLEPLETTHPELFAPR